MSKSSEILQVKNELNWIFHFVLNMVLNFNKSKLDRNPVLAIYFLHEKMMLWLSLLINKQFIIYIAFNHSWEDWKYSDIFREPNHDFYNI